MAPQSTRVAGAKPSVEGRVKRKSKSRTQDISSSSEETSDTTDTTDTSSPSEDSSADEDAASGASQDTPDATPVKVHTPQGGSNSNDTQSPVPGQPEAAPTRERDDFSAFYLRNVASELAEDLDKVRSANDFNEGKMPMLIRALKQGEAIFSEEERRTVMQGSAKG